MTFKRGAHFAIGFPTITYAESGPSDGPDTVWKKEFIFQLSQKNRTIYEALIAADQKTVNAGLLIMCGNSSVGTLAIDADPPIPGDVNNDGLVNIDDMLSRS